MDAELRAKIETAAPPFEKQNVRSRLTTFDELARLVDEWNRGPELKALSQKFGVSAHQLRSRVDALIKAGVPMKEARPSISKGGLIQMLKLHRSGCSFHEIGRQLGITHSRAQYHIEAYYRESASGSTVAKLMASPPENLTLAQACRIHLIDLKRAGHSPRFTEFRIAPDVRALRVSNPSLSNASYCGSPAWSCAG